MAYDAATKQVVLFGGASTTGGLLGDTWTWNGTTWTQQFPSVSPQARADAMMAYDAAHQQVVLFGGANDGSSAFVGDTWVWNGSTWRQVSSSGPSLRAGATMAYDAARQQVVLFGGFTTCFGCGDIYLNDTWVWDGSIWTQVGPVHDPPARTEATMAYDAVEQQMVLFGGVNNGVNLGDTWTWDGNDWTQQAPATSPSARVQASMAYDTALGQVVLFSGVDTGGEEGDIWMWSGNNWTKEMPLTSPPARATAMMADFPAQQQLILFGGGNISNNNLSDTWTLQLAGNLGTANVCPSGTNLSPCSQSGTFPFRFTTPATGISPNVVTQGALALDFTDARTGTCYLNGTGHSYAAGDTCTVIVKFAPKYAGTRYGAVQLRNSSGTVVASALANGTGTGPQLTFGPTNTVTKLGGGFSTNPNPNSLAVDGSGNVYIPDSGNHAVKKIPPGCTASSCVTTVGGGFNSPSGIAVDGAGNVYAADSGNNAVYEISSACVSSSCVTTLGGGFTSPSGVAVDKSGNVYVVESGATTVTVVPPGCTATNCETSLGGGLNNPVAVAVDGSGNVYVAEFGNLASISPGCTASSCVTMLGGDWLSDRSFSPNGVAVDGSGNVYTAGHDGVFEMPPGCASFSCVTGVGGDEDNFGIAVDAGGNIYSEFGGVVEEEAQSNPPSLNFDTVVGSENGLSLKLRNIGNAPLTFPAPNSGENPSASANYIVQDATTCPEVTASSSAGTLAAGASCELYVAFVPTTIGTISGSLVLTDNNLNVTWATQSIAMNGTAAPTYGTPFVTVTPSSSNVTTTQPLSATVTVSGYPGDPIPTGSVRVTSGSYTSAPTTLTAGSTIIHIPAGQLAVGNDTLTATYTPDSGSSTTYTGATGAAPMTVVQGNGSCTTPNPNPNPNPAVFAVPGDFNGDCRSDILWRNSASQQVYVWLMNGISILSQGGAAGPASSWVIQNVGDFDGDGRADVLWRNTSTGEVYLWLMNGTAIASQASLGSITPDWVIQGVGDFNGDGKDDVLWRNSTSGAVYLWLMNGASIASQGGLGNITSDWVIQGVGDFNGDGKADILWRNSSSELVYVWLMNGTSIVGRGGVFNPASDWVIQSMGDFDGDGKSDVLWRNSTTGQVYIWLMNGTTIAGQGSPLTVSSDWVIQGDGDYDGYSRSDILWRNSVSGEIYLWLMNGTSIAAQGGVLNVSSDWQIASLSP